MKTIQKLSLSLAPLLRMEPPGWFKIMKALRIGDEEATDVWTGAPTRTIRGKLHGYQMQLDLTNWGDQMAYFLGRHYDLELQQAMMAVLKPGDRFVDVGANIGLITMLAARLVGPAGRVDSFEPNPVCCAQFERHLELNAICNVHLHKVGLSDHDGSATLWHIADKSHLSGTVGSPLPDEADLVSEPVEVAIRKGDDILAEDPRPAVLVKIDVEGNEFKALRGIARSLRTWRPVIEHEFAESQLQRAGNTCEELYDFIAGMDYTCYAMDLHRVGLKHQLRLLPVADLEDAKQYKDLMWLLPDGPSQRLHNLIARTPARAGV
jgi:FkbM family methyltransferase